VKHVEPVDALHGACLDLHLLAVAPLTAHLAGRRSPEYLEHHHTGVLPALRLRYVVQLERAELLPGSRVSHAARSRQQNSEKSCIVLVHT
jgi:hypothetical protein